MVLDIKPMLLVQAALKELDRQDIKIHYVRSTDTIGFVKGSTRVQIPADVVMQVSERGAGSVKELIAGFISSCIGLKQ